MKTGIPQGEYGPLLCEMLLQEYKELLLVKKETSQVLQEKCRVLYMMGRVKKGKEEIM